MTTLICLFLLPIPLVVLYAVFRFYKPSKKDQLINLLKGTMDKLHPVPNKIVVDLLAEIQDMSTELLKEVDGRVRKILRVEQNRIIKQDWIQYPTLSAAEYIQLLRLLDLIRYNKHPDNIAFQELARRANKELT